METYGEIVNWVTSRSGAVLVLSATLPLALLAREGRSAACAALGVFAGAVMLILFEIESTVSAVLVMLASSLLSFAVLHSTRKRLGQVEDRLEEVASAIDNLEIAEERRQTFSIRRPPGPRLLKRLQSVTEAPEKSFSPSTEAAYRKEMPALADIYPHEQRAADLLPELAIPAPAHPGEPNTAFLGYPGDTGLQPDNSTPRSSSPPRRRRKLPA
jgi:hypothetical protein